MRAKRKIVFVGAAAGLVVIGAGAGAFVDAAGSGEPESMPELPSEMPADQIPADVVALIGEPGEPLDAVIERIEARFRAYMASRWIEGEGDREAHRERLLQLGERVDASMLELHQRWIDREGGSYSVSPSSLWGDSFADREPGWKDKEEDWENERELTRAWLGVARESGLLDEVLDVGSYRLAVQKVIAPDQPWDDNRHIDFNSSARMCLRLLWAEAVDRFEQGDVDRGIDAAAAIFELAEIPASQGLLVDNMVAMALLSAICESLLAAVERGVFDAEQAEEMLSRMPSLDWLAMRIDHAYWVYDNLYFNGRNALPYYYRSDGRLRVPLAMKSLLGSADYQLYRFQALHDRGVRHANAGELASSKERWTIVAAEEFAKPTREQDLSRIEYPRRFNGALLPAPPEILENYIGLVDSNERKVRATKLAVAIEVYRGRHGAPPRRLEDLTPGVIERLPEDPYARDGRFRYRLDEASSLGYILYSVSNDGEDHGGVRSEPNAYGVIFNTPPGTDYVILPRR